MRYWGVMRADSSKIELRRQMVRVAQADGVSQAARQFGTSRQTVRKWKGRYEAEGVRGLADRSRARKRIAHKTPESTARRLLELRRRYPGWGPDRLGAHFVLGCSRTAAARIFRQAGLTRRRKKKRVRNDLRAEKARLKPFERLQIDTKELRDIATYAEMMKIGGLPRFEYTARDLRNGRGLVCPRGHQRFDARGPLRKLSAGPPEKTRGGARSGDRPDGQRLGVWRRRGQKG